MLGCSRRARVLFSALRKAASCGSEPAFAPATQPSSATRTGSGASLANVDPSAQADGVRDRKLVDVLTVSVQAGHGGPGCSTLWGSKAKGRNQPADGGNGGRGGDVYARASSRLDRDSLAWISYWLSLCRPHDYLHNYLSRLKTFIAAKAA